MFTQRKIEEPSLVEPLNVREEKESVLTRENQERGWFLGGGEKF